MQKYIKVYLNHFDYKEQYIPCEKCNAPSVDIHHIYGRGKNADVITNLMALCRDCHTKAHSVISKSEMQSIHNKFLKEIEPGAKLVLIK